MTVVVEIVVNGEACEVPDGTSVADLVRLRGARDRGSAVAVDGEVVPRGQWPSQVLRNGQAVEIVTAVQGG